VDGYVLGHNEQHGGIAVLFLNLIYELSKFPFLKVYVISYGMASFPKFLGEVTNVPMKNLDTSPDHMVRNVWKLNPTHTVFLPAYYSHIPGYCNYLSIYDTIPEEYNMIQPGTHHVFKRDGILRWANSIMSIANETKRVALEYYPTCPKDIIKVSPCRVNKRFRPQSQSEVDRVLKKYNLKQPFFLYVGTRPFGKGAEDIWGGFVKVDPKLRDNFQMAFIGGGGPESWEPQYMEKTKSYIHIPGAPHEDMPALMTATYALIFTTVYRGFGIPVYEALACGTPVIVYDDFHFNYPEAAEFVKTKKNHDEIGAAITKMMNKEYRDKKSILALKESERYGGGDGEHGWNEMAFDYIDHLLFGPKRGKECDALIKKIVL